MFSSGYAAATCALVLTISFTAEAVEALEQIMRKEVKETQQLSSRQWGEHLSVELEGSGRIHRIKHAAFAAEDGLNAKTAGSQPSDSGTQSSIKEVYDPWDADASVTTKASTDTGSSSPAADEAVSGAAAETSVPQEEAQKETKDTGIKPEFDPKVRASGTAAASRSTSELKQAAYGGDSDAAVSQVPADIGKSVGEIPKTKSIGEAKDSGLKPEFDTKVGGSDASSNANAPTNESQREEAVNAGMSSVGTSEFGTDADTTDTVANPGVSIPTKDASTKDSNVSSGVSSSNEAELPVDSGVAGSVAAVAKLQASRPEKTGDSAVALTPQLAATLGMQDSTSEPPAVGAEGDPGVSGLRGVVGPPGPPGDAVFPNQHRGPTGLAGRPGPMGHPGINGTRGAQGPPGTDTLGFPGPPGLRGELGPTGPIGPAGRQGTPGMPGSQGLMPPELQSWQRGIDAALARLREVEGTVQSGKDGGKVQKLMKRLFRDRSRLGGLKAMSQALATKVADDNVRTMESVRDIVEQSKQLTYLDAYRVANAKDIESVEKHLPKPPAYYGHPGPGYPGHAGGAYGRPPYQQSRQPQAQSGALPRVPPGMMPQNNIPPGTQQFYHR